MGIERQKKLRQELRDIKATLEAEREWHKTTVALLDAMRQAARPARGKILWYESCIDEYQRLKQLGIVVDPF